MGCIDGDNSPACQNWGASLEEESPPCTAGDWNCFVMNFDPAYALLAGVTSAWEAAQSPCASNWSIAGYSAEALFGLAGSAAYGLGVARLASPLLATTSDETGTVWDSISPTQQVYQGTVLPRSFVLSVDNGDSFWIAPNASEHILERLGSVPYTLQPTEAQVMLTSLQAAIEDADDAGISYGKLVNVEGWQLMFSAPRLGEPYPVVYHALYTG
jgi:filamentous hemagglutinin